MINLAASDCLTQRLLQDYRNGFSSITGVIFLHWRDG
jgi:hypothetical protein